MRLAFDAAGSANAAAARRIGRREPGVPREAGRAAGREAARMQFLAITRRRTERFTQAEFDAVLGEEGEAARDHYRRGAFRSLHSRGDVPGAVVLVEAADAAEAAALVGAMPLARLEMMDVQIVPLLPYRVFAGT